ncbi:MAG: hypothetical protein SGARI_004704 [Bacillariaceae sp.]
MGDSDITPETCKPWAGCGLRNNNGGGGTSSNSFLLQDDIQCALDHDLLQHERMIAVLRSLMASLAQLLDAFGRRLDEWMMQDVNGMYAQQLFALLSEDLYNKQVVSQKILDSCHVGMLEEDAIPNIVKGKQPHEIAKQAMQQWKSGGSSRRSEKDALMERFLAIM